MKHSKESLAVVLSTMIALATTVAQAANPEIPKCATRKGTLSIMEPDKNWWSSHNLESPEALIKVFVSESNCFTLLDRGKGLAAAKRERELASGGEFRVASNVRRGQM